MGFWNSLGKAADKTYQTTMTVAEAIQDWVKEHPRAAKILEREGVSLDYTLLRDPKYRDIPFEGKVIVGSKWCGTIGEWQDAVSEEYKNYSDGHNYGNAMQDDNRY